MPELRTRRQARKKPTSQRKKIRLTSRNADKHVLYQLSVQDAEREVSVLRRIFRRHRGRPPASLREDFCGTALLCAEWVKTNRKHTATGVDIDAAVLAWGTKHNLAPLGEASERVTLHQKSVLDAVPGKHDLVCGFNFSYWVFRDRATLRSYFRKARAGLVKDGLLMLDAFGGWEANEVMEEYRKVKGFTYVWDQASYDPINGTAINHIHFRFPDGSEMKKAFTYFWRHWTLPELSELLYEAGFSKVTVYWDTSEDDDDENYQPRKVAENQPGWLAYIVAER